MDFSSWSPSHTILVLVVFVTFIGQVAVYFYRKLITDRLSVKNQRNSRELEMAPALCMVQCRNHFQIVGKK